ncbi:MAG: type II toxin-antitoxin system antitoxin SocA domain-containing protein [Candidatus Moraniibacteriota bacterium]
MTRLEETILYLLQKAKMRKKGNLSKLELFKYIYLLEVESYRFTAKSFFNSEVTFIRQKNGPISVDIYKSLSNLESQDKLEIKAVRTNGYPYPRHCIALKKAFKDTFEQSERFFINSIIEDYMDLTIKNLKEIAYKTEPMMKIIEEEKARGNQQLTGAHIDFRIIHLDEDMVDLIAS